MYNRFCGLNTPPLLFCLSHVEYVAGRLIPSFIILFIHLSESVDPFKAVGFKKWDWEIIVKVYLPFGPGRPGSPSSPGGPGTPGSPTGPFTPGSPGIPGRPFIPAGPGGPLSPSSPFQPGAPETNHNDNLCEERKLASYLSRQ